MTMTNLIQNLDFNFTNSVLVGLSATLFSYSMYCFITKSISLGYKTIYFSPTSYDETINQTINAVEKHYADATAQTDDTMLYDYLNERIMANMTPDSSYPSHYSPEEFIREYESNPLFTDYIDNMVSWSNNVAESADSVRRVFKNGSYSTTNSEHQYVNIMETIR